jgi:hypothetical protein
VPRTLDHVVLRGLSHNPQERFGSALEMAAALEAAFTPSSQREVSDWVARAAIETLQERRDVLRKIENEPEPDIPQPGESRPVPVDVVRPPESKPAPFDKSASYTKGPFNKTEPFDVLARKPESNPVSFDESISFNENEPFIESPTSPSVSSSRSRTASARTSRRVAQAPPAEVLPTADLVEDVAEDVPEEVASEYLAQADVPWPHLGPHTTHGWADALEPPPRPRIDLRPVAFVAALAAVLLVWFASDHLRSTTTSSSSVGFPTGMAEPAPTFPPPQVLPTAVEPGPVAESPARADAVPTARAEGVPTARLEAAPTQRVEVAPPSRVDPTLGRAARGVVPRAAAPPRAPRSSCNPPYTMDHGIRVPKPECL